MPASPASPAQTKLEIYGRIDVNVETVTNAPDGAGGSHSVTGMQSGGTGGSRWGLRGTEDLGNGWSALFDLENGFNIANGRNTATNLMFNRNAYLALRHRDYGTLGFGRQYSPADGSILVSWLSWVATGIASGTCWARATSNPTCS